MQLLGQLFVAAQQPLLCTLLPSSQTTEFVKSLDPQNPAGWGAGDPPGEGDPPGAGAAIGAGPDGVGADGAEVGTGAGAGPGIGALVGAAAPPDGVKES